MLYGPQKIRPKFFTFQSTGFQNKRFLWVATNLPQALSPAAGYQVHYTYAETEATQFGVMEEMAKKYKVQVKRWSDKDLAVFEKTWLEVLKEESAKDPLFKKIADDYLAFRKDYARWGDAQSMKPTYLPKGAVKP